MVRDNVGSSSGASSRERIIMQLRAAKVSGRSTTSIRSIVFFVAATTIALVCHLALFYPSQYAQSISSAYQPNSERALSSGGDDVTATEAHFELFGGIASLQLMVASVSIIIIVCAVQLVEYLFHNLHLLTHDTPFYQMVQSIEKELMVVGFTAFIFKIIVNTTTFLSREWFHSLEYADILIPIFSFAYCAMGLMLILVSIRICNAWSQAYHHRLVEMLDSYFDLPGFVGYLPYGVWLAPFSATVAMMEFRIFHNVFCDTYKIQRAAFAFNEYVEKVFEKYILMIIEIRPLDWLLVCVLVLLNWARRAIHLDYRSCTSEQAQHRLLSAGQEQHNCEAENARLMFVIAGAIIFGGTVLMALESRRLEVAILRQKGIRSIHAYPSYLQHMEESAVAASLEQFRLNFAELKASAEEVKYATIQKELNVLLTVVGGAQRTSHVLSKLRSAFAHTHHPLPVPGTPRSPPAANPDGAAPDLRPQSAPKQRLNRRSASHKFSVSVKQAWKSKRKTSKRDRRKSLISGATESTARIKASIRTGLKSMQLHRAATVEVFSVAFSGSQKARSQPQAQPQVSGKVYTFSSHFGSVKKRSAASEKKVLPGIEDAPDGEEDDLSRGFAADGVLLTTSAPLSGIGDSDRFGTGVSLRLGTERERESERLRSRNSSLDESLHTVVDSGKDAATEAVRYDAVPDIGPDRAPSAEYKRTENSSTTASDKYTFHSAAFKHQPDAAGGSESPDLQQQTGESDRGGVIMSESSFSFPAQAHGGAEASGKSFGINTETAGADGYPTTSSERLLTSAGVEGSAREYPVEGSAREYPVEGSARESGLPDSAKAGNGWVEEEGTISDVFFMAWPELYLEGVQSLIMIIALYYSLYFTNFVADGTAQPVWKILTLLPALLSSFLLIYITKCAVLLSALHAVDCDAILEVLDQTEGAKKLSALIHDKIVARLREMGSEPQAELFELFAQIDLNGDGALSREEFAVFMRTFEIHSDRRRWMQVFRGIDKDFDGSISFEEFFLFLFPDHTIGLALQKKKERILEARVQEKAVNRSEALQKNRSKKDAQYLPLGQR